MIYTLYCCVPSRCRVPHSHFKDHICIFWRGAWATSQNAGPYQHIGCHRQPTPQSFYSF